MALTREEAAREFLISVLESGEIKLATAAIAAMSIYRDDDKLRKRAEEALSGPKKDELVAALRRAFD
jgi:predicted HTH domain antitoxin